MTLAIWFTIVDCWLPIVVSGAAVFFLSFMMWMVLPHHRSDWAPMPDEDAPRTMISHDGVDHR